ncbi:MAG TPA: TlpA disulfide reductase family protein [Planctomycetota bacterium]|nr:TlpA disulfide reductase family protein [Planctomycetota bacterium]
MVALEKGKRAPDFTLPSDDGKKSFTLKGLLDGKGAVLAFFKTECPTCQLEFPFVERIAKALAGTGVHVIGIGQNPGKEIGSFRKAYGVTLPVATDLEPYKVSSAYGLTHVPTVFLVEPKGTIRRTEIGFSKENLEGLLRDACAMAGTASPGLFRPSDEVPPMQPG